MAPCGRRSVRKDPVVAVNRLLRPVLGVLVLSLGLAFGLAGMAGSTTLRDVKPHAPFKKPWNEQWFYYVHDPSVGYFKVSLQSYLLKDSPDDALKGYVHVMFTSVEGKTVIFEVFSDELNYMLAN